MRALGLKDVKLLGGDTLLVHALRGLEACPDVGSGVVASPAAVVEQVRDLLAAADLRCRWEVVAGSGNRQGSVARALAAVAADVETTPDGFRLRLDQPAFGVAAGQTAVLYEGDVVVGVGHITGSAP